MQEEWRKIKEFGTSYEVSNHGRIRTKKGMILSPRMRPCNGLPYLKVNLAQGEKRKLRAVHRLVAQAFVPNPENKEQVNHIDNDRENNRADNLEWVTPQENIDHKVQAGRQVKGERVNSAKLLQDDVSEIRISPLSPIQLAHQYGVCVSTISAVLTRKTWKHL